MTEPVEIPASLAGERVDRVVALLSGRSRAEVAELVGAGAVLVDDRPVRSRHYRVRAGEQLAVAVLPAGPDGGRDDGGEAPVAFGVVYEDAALVVVDKPAGLVVHPGAGHATGTLVAGLVARYPDLAEARGGRWDPGRPGIVHRLDKDTSGLLAVARTPEALASLSGQLADRTMGRTYEALALGSLAAGEGTIEAPIGRSARDPTRMAVRADGRPARTHYRVLDRFAEPIEASHLEVRLDTGRTHQIRVHLRAIGHPIAGDARYGGARNELGLARPFLHATRLSLRHPVTGERLELTSPLPPDLAGVLAALTQARAG